MRPRPLCPTCAVSTNVRTLGGGTHGKYRYTCDECDIFWQQIPHSLAQTSLDESVLETSIESIKQEVVTTKKSSGICKRRGSSYKCGKCGLPKKGHTCLLESSSSQIEVTSSYQPPSNALIESISLDIPFQSFSNINNTN